eukprot:355134-Chlamydomonas_euryale.AAC.4
MAEPPSRSSRNPHNHVRLGWPGSAREDTRKWYHCSLIASRSMAVSKLLGGGKPRCRLVRRAAWDEALAQVRDAQKCALKLQLSSCTSKGAARGRRFGDVHGVAGSCSRQKALQT